MCRMFDRTLNSADAKNIRITCRKVSAHALVWGNVGWFHQHNNHYNILTSLMLGISQSQHREVFCKLANQLCKPIDIYGLSLLLSKSRISLM